MSEAKSKVNLTWNNAGKPILGAILTVYGFFAYLWLCSLPVIFSGWWLLGAIVASGLNSVLLFHGRFLFAVIWFAIFLAVVCVVGAYVPEESFSKEHLCHNPRTGEMLTQGGGGYWSSENVFDRHLECIDLKYDRFISDCGWVGESKYQINLEVNQDVSIEDVKRVALLSLKYHRVVSSCAGFSRYVPINAHKVQKDPRVIELRRQMDKCAAAVWANYGDDVAEVKVADSPAQPRCDFSSFGLMLEALRIRREVRD